MTSHDADLARRMARPQRHRLLQGYPMLPLMRRAAAERREVRHLDGALTRHPGTEAEPAWIRFDESRPMLVGILPHTQCNPKVEGCGFCTFPHDRYSKRALHLVVDGVERQIAGFFSTHPELAARRIPAVYLGGATANLTPRDTLRSLLQTLARHVDLRAAEITLEGVPSLFTSLFAGPFEVLLEAPARHRRISMGVQTFDDRWLARMGRQHFGDRDTVAKVVDKAHRMGLTASGDFLINLPGERLDAMLEDVRTADELGFDQICVYHLVLTEGAGTPWSKDPAMLSALPDNAAACKNFLTVRRWLLDHGYVQATLTNFERAEVHRSERRFVYEEHSFSPERFDAIGFGPLAISTFVDRERRRAVKHVRDKQIESSMMDDLYFPYGEEDLRLLHVTRTLARLRIDRAAYRDVFGGDLADHFGDAISAVERARLATLSDEALELTARGMFYADAVAGLLAASRVEALREAGAGQHTRDLLARRLAVDFMG